MDPKDPNKYCPLCAATFNNAHMALQHYNGRKHQRNLSRQELLKGVEDHIKEGKQQASRPHWGYGSLPLPPLNTFTFNNTYSQRPHVSDMRCAVKFCGDVPGPHAGKQTPEQVRSTNTHLYYISVK